MLKPGYILLVIILIYFIAGIISINSISITADEPSHLNFGIRMLKGNPARIDPEKDNSKMPISAINVLPRAAEQLFNKNLHKLDNGVSDIIHGRYITLLFSILTILLVYKWGKELYGVHAGIFSAFLFSLCPNNLANAVMVTTDAYAVFFILATMYTLWKYCNNSSAKNFIAFACLLALSQLAKQSLFHLYILAPLCIIIYALATKQNFKVKTVCINLLIAITISWVIINAGFVFYKINNRLGEFHFMSHLFQLLQQVLPGGFPIPLSSSFVEGLDQAKYYDQLGGGFQNSSFGTTNILGHSKQGGSFWYYYFVSIFFKTPVTYLILIAWAKIILLKNFSWQSFIKNEFFLFAPVVYYLLLMSFMYNTQCGIRHIIFIYPFLFIFSGSIITQLKSKMQKGFLIFLCLFLILSVSRYWNNFYAYTNEFIIDKKNAFKIVGTGNINITQAYNYMQKYLQQHPDVQYAPVEPKTGKFLVSVDEYMDVWNTGKYKWLQQYQPVDHVAYCYLVFDIKLP